MAVSQRREWRAPDRLDVSLQAPHEAVRARPADAWRIQELIKEGVPGCLPLSLGEVRKHLHRTAVVRECGRTVATATVRPAPGGRLELRSVAVAPTAAREGHGTTLVLWAISEAMRQGRELVCVTTRPGLFQHLGFDEIPLEALPPKPEREAFPSVKRRVAMTHRYLRAKASREGA